MQMINTRSLLVSILGAVLSATSLMCAQNMKPAEPTAIQELALQSQPSLAAVLSQSDSVSPPFNQQRDLSRYRKFQLGMSLPTVANRAGMEPSQATVIHQRPALIQELDWWVLPSLESSSRADPVNEVLFTFYNGQLFRMVVRYDSYKTEGLTNEDLVEAISAKYGTPTRSIGKTTLVSSSVFDGVSEKVVAGWKTSQCSVSLLRSPDNPSFEMLLSWNRVDALARTATAEAVRLDEQEAPQRAIELQKKQHEENVAAQAKARLANKAAFRL
jgi:hypothetical protein